MNIKNELLAVLDEVMVLKGRSSSFTEECPLFSSLPEMDSMAVVAIISELEDRFGIEVDDDDISGDTFRNLGSLMAYVAGKTGDMRQAA